MGTSTDAILFYGLAFKDVEGNECGWEPWLPPNEQERAKLAEEGHHIEVHSAGTWNEWIAGDFSWEDLYELRSGSSPDAAPVGLAHHCSDGCAMPFVAVVESENRAKRGYPQEITSLEVKPEWDQQIRDFCQVLGIETDEQPKWWLVSWWG